MRITRGDNWAFFFLPGLTLLALAGTFIAGRIHKVFRGEEDKEKYISIDELDKDKWIIDRHKEFDVVWGFHLSQKKKDGKLSTRLLNNSDINPDKEWNLPLQEIDNELQCRFERSLTPNFIPPTLNDDSGDTFSVSGRVICLLNESRIYFDLVHCIYDIEQQKKSEWDNPHATEMIKSKRFKVYFGYSCAIYPKKN